MRGGEKKSNTWKFQKGDPRARELGRKGGAVTTAQKRARREPYRGTVIDVADAVGLVGPSWTLLRAFLKAADGLEMSAGERELILRHDEREPPPGPVREAVLVCGRRSGKSRGGALKAFHRAISFDSKRLAPGETAVFMLLAADRRQARMVFGYLKSMCELPEFAPYVFRILKDAIEFRSGVNVEIHTASFRSVRGYTCVGAIFDEVAYWYSDEASANPDVEIYSAILPSMATVPDSQILMLSNPYGARGLLWDVYQRAYGKEDPDTLVLNADTASMNPLVPAGIIERAFQDDPVVAAAEYGVDGQVAFRRDVVAFLDADVLRGATALDRHELPPVPDVRYVAFVDPSGGSQDSFTLAIAHKHHERVIVDCVREVRPPFSPDGVVADFATLLRTYRIGQVTGDRYAGEWPRERFRVHGITYEPSQLTKSDIYRELLPALNAGRVELLDHARLRAQFLGLERRVSRAGKDSIDHSPGGHDDLANATAGAVVLLQPMGATVDWRVGDLGVPGCREVWYQRGKDGRLRKLGETPR